MNSTTFSLIQLFLNGKIAISFDEEDELEDFLHILYGCPMRRSKTIIGQFHVTEGDYGILYFDINKDAADLVLTTDYTNHPPVIDYKIFTALSNKTII